MGITGVGRSVRRRVATATTVSLYLIALLAALALSAVPEKAGAQGGVDEPPRDSAEALSEYTMGVYLLENDSAEKAIPHLESAWIHSGHDNMIGEKLAEAYFGVGDFDACERVARELLTSDSQNAVAMLLIAKMRYLGGEKQEAVDYLEKLRKVAEPSFEVERLLGRIYSELGQDTEALEAYQAAIKLDPYYPYLYYKTGMLLKKLGRNADAEDAFRNALKLEPRFAEAVSELVSILIEDKRYAEAEQVLEPMFEQHPDDPDIMMSMASVYAEQGKIDDAIRLLEASKQKGSLPQEGVFVLGRLYYLAKDYDESLRTFQALYIGSGKSAELARVLGEVSLKAGKSDASLQYYRDAIAAGPDDYRNYLALFFATSPKFAGPDAPVLKLPREETSHLLAQARDRLEDDDADGAFLVGMCYQDIDSLEAAQALLARANTIDPEDERVLLNLAGVLEKLKRYKEAEPYLVRLHKKKPDDATVCNFYGYLLALLGKQLDLAERLVKTALQHDPDNGYYIDSLGWVYFKKGDYGKAVIELEKASSLVADDPVVLEHLGDAYKSARRYREALAAYERSKELQGENSAILDKIDAARKRLGD